MNKLKQNGWYEVDILDLSILSFVFEKGEVTRGDVKKKFKISKEKSRSRLEKLVEKKFLNKKELCRYCNAPISKCECGNYAKEIYYYKNPEEELIEMKLSMEEFVKKFQFLID